MISSPTSYIGRAHVCDRDEQRAVAQLAQQLQMDNMGAVVFFCSADYDLKKLTFCFNQQFDCPVIGCTTAGEIGPKYQNHSIVAASFSSQFFHFHTAPIHALENFQPGDAKVISDKLQTELAFSDSYNQQDMFGLLLIDGLSMQEEKTTAYLHSVFDGVDIIGGSAGDSLSFTETSVFINGSFHTDSAVFALIESKLPFKIFRWQHYQPSAKDMVITDADPSKRIIYEIDGGPAATELANIIGIDKNELTMEVYSTCPVMIQIGDEWYVRSIQSCNSDDSLSFACAIDTGLILTVGECSGLVESLEEQVTQIQSEFSDIVLTLGCDCIHRRLEIMETGVQNEVEDLLSKVSFLGFNTYGEQYNSVHVNQTMTGVAIGHRK